MKSQPLHDPSDRELVAFVGAWELRQFAESDPRATYFAAKGFAHVQLWHPASRVSIITPSRITGGSFELWSETYQLRLAAPAWQSIADALQALHVAPPTRNEVRAIDRWFVLPGETRAGRLLRSWWGRGRLFASGLSIDSALRQRGRSMDLASSIDGSAATSMAGTRASAAMVSARSFATKSVVGRPRTTPIVLLRAIVDSRSVAFGMRSTRTPADRICSIAAGGPASSATMTRSGEKDRMPSAESVR